MRKNIVHPQADQLVYEIRRIILTAGRFQQAGVPMVWENIGDPVAKGEPIADWIIEHMKAVVGESASWGYSPTKGVLETREFIAADNNQRGGVQITPEDIIFCNGLGDAVSKLYGYLDPGARVLCPSPSYSIHVSQEWFHAGPGAPKLLYHLDPAKNWQPDLDEIRTTVRENPSIAGITLINPDNPTSSTWPEHILRGVVEIAGEYGLFLVADEIYHRLTYNGVKSVLLSQLIGSLPGISLKGISKDYPWPGSRCGWMEIYNAEASPSFKRFVYSLFEAKMLEVCATTQPQLTIPRVMGDSRWQPHLDARCLAFEERSQQFYDAFKDLPGALPTRPDGAFYAPLVFEPGVLNDRQSLTVDNPAARKLLDEVLAQETNLCPDKRLALHLMAGTGICVVPMSGFHTDLQGFRMTLLEQDPQQRSWNLGTLRSKLEEYLASA